MEESKRPENSNDSLPSSTWLMFYGLVPSSNEALFDGIVNACFRNETIHQYQMLQRKPKRMKRQLRNEFQDEPEENVELRDNVEMSDSLSGEEEDTDDECTNGTLIQEGVAHEYRIEEMKNELSLSNESAWIEDEPVNSKEQVVCYLKNLAHVRKLNILENLGGPHLSIAFADLALVPNSGTETFISSHPHTRCWFLHASECLVTWKDDTVCSSSAPINFGKLQSAHAQLTNIGSMFGIEEEPRFVFCKLASA